jgi:hypothetical protein
MLSEEDRLTVLAMIAKQAAETDEEPAPQPEKKRKQHRKPKQNVDKRRSRGKIGARKKTSGRGRGENFDLEGHRQMRKNRGGGKVIGRKESLEFGKDVAGEDNDFIRLGFDQLHKNDVAIDKKLSGGRMPRRGPKRASPQGIDAKCTRCGAEWEGVNPQFTYRDDDGDVVFVCDECMGPAQEQE